MSWISGLADKAEQILTTIDQNAAEKLQKKNLPRRVEDVGLTEVVSQNAQEHRQRVTPAKMWEARVRSSPTLSHKPKDEDKLIDFLNDTACPSSESIQNESKPVPADEKVMLKNEIRVLNNELSLLLHRTRAAEKEREHLKMKLTDSEQLQRKQQEDLEKLVKQVKILEHRNEIIGEEQKEENSRQLKTEREKIVQLGAEVHSLKDTQESLTRKLEARERECTILKEQRQQEVNSLQQQLAELHSELDQYRARAQRTLCDKEALITQLRANNSDDSVYASLDTELTQLREERKQLVEELAEAQTQSEASRIQLVEGEQDLAKAREMAAVTRRELTDLLTTETNRRRILEDDCHLHNQELRMVREELSLCQGQLRLLEAELRTRPPVLIPQETEHRLSNLTKTLILKQTALESTNIKCNQLRMQVEELEHKCKEQLMLLHQARVVGANDTDDTKAQVPSFLVESPLDTGMTRRVKRAYSSLDAVSIRTGIFLRRYPLARIFVILYMVLLHSLVLTVLYSHKPDNTTFKYNPSS